MNNKKNHKNIIYEYQMALGLSRKSLVQAAGHFKKHKRIFVELLDVT